MTARHLEQYAPWALITGASEGTGRAFAKALAARGVPSVLVARRPEPLQALKDEIQREFQITCATASVDLSAEDALAQIKSACGDREIGLYISNAGADPNGSHFLDVDFENWDKLARINVLTPMACVHHFGGLMRQRQRGGIILVGSGACYSGAAYMATYSSAKAFQLCFSESLWKELKAFNIDVLHMVLSTTDTPEFRRLLSAKGKPLPRNLAAPEAVAEKALEQLGKGPVYNWGQKLGLRAGWRKFKVNLISKFSEKLVFGER